MTRSAAFCVALVAAAASSTGAVAALSDGDVTPATVLLLAGRNSEPLAGRLAAELMSVGLEVQREEPADEAAPDPVAAALRARARAAVWVPPGAAAAEVWIIDREAGRSTIRQSITAEGEGMSPLVALRTVEFLRASLLGVPRGAGARGRAGGAAGGASNAGAANAANATKPANDGGAANGAVAANGSNDGAGGGDRPAEADGGDGSGADSGDAGVVTRPGPPGGPHAPGPRFTVALGGGASSSIGGGIGVVPSMAAVIRVPVYGPLSAEVLGLLSLSQAHAGGLSFRASMAGGGLSLRLAGGRRATLDAGAGGMAILIHADEASMTRSIGGSVYGRIGGGVSFTPWLGLRAEALLGYALPALGLRRPPPDDVDITSWGPLFSAGMLNLEARWE